MIPSAIDWDNTFLPTVLALLNGGNIYAHNYFNPPWAILPLIPFAILPYEIGRITFLLAQILAFGLVAFRLRVKPLPMILFLLAPFAFDSLAWGNIEALALLGLAMPLPIGLVFLAIKPQITIGIMVFLLWQVFRTGGVRQLAKVLVLPSIVFLASIIFFGAWWLPALNYNELASVNASLFPGSLPIGLGLFVIAFRNNDLRPALAASPMLFPTISPQCWLVVFLALASLPLASLIAVVSSWIAILHFRLG